jgi:diguanylate cyclase (GGDEF)-like protein/PAS domain S-box-containing protein
MIACPEDRPNDAVAAKAAAPSSAPVAASAGATEATLREEVQRLQTELARLREGDMTYRALLEYAPILISTKDLNGTVLMASRYFNTLDGIVATELVGRSVFDLFSADNAAQLWHNDQRAAREGRAIACEEEVVHRDKTVHTYMTVKFPLRDGDGKIVGTGAVSTDISDTKAAQIDSMTDELTGLKNRRYFNMRFLEEQRRAHRDRRILTLLLADIDHFKGYNDRYGHPEGDSVLVSVAQALRTTLSRPGDLAFRLGGDEFACLYATGHEDESIELAERIRACVAGQRIAHAGNAPFGYVTLSIGLAFVGPDAEAPQCDVYQHGDQALYRAKHRGRNCVAR